MKQSYLFLLFVLFSFQNYAQESYKTSKVIMKNGDTLTYYVSNFMSSKELQVKKKMDSKSFLLDPKAVKEYFYDGNSFVSKIVTITNYKTVNQGSRLVKIKDSGLGNVMDTVFLKREVVGKVNLYSTRYTNQESYLFVEKGDEFYEIPHEYVDIEVDDFTKSQMKNRPLQLISSLGVTVKERQDYLNVLQIVLNDGDRYTKIEPFKYSENIIIELVKNYNRQNGIKNGGQVGEVIKQRLYFGLNIGSIYILKDEYINPKNSNSPLALNIYVMYPLGHNRNTFLKLDYNNYSYSAQSTTRSFTSLSIGVRKASLQGAVRPYVGANLAVGYQYLNTFKSTMELSNTIEAGVLIPIKKVNLLLNLTFTPLSFQQHGYQFVSYSLGVLF